MKKYKEMFPELKDASNAMDFLPFIRLGKKINMGENIELMSAEQVPKEPSDLELFIRKCLKKSNYTPGEYEFKLIEILLDTLIHDNIINKERHSLAVDILIAAAILHNIYIDKNKPYTSLFKAREEFEELLEDEDYQYKRIGFDYADLLFETIEKQLGAKSKLKDLQPQTGSPIELFSDLVWLVRETDYIK